MMTIMTDKAAKGSINQPPLNTKESMLIPDSFVFESDDD